MHSGKKIITFFVFIHKNPQNIFFAIPNSRQEKIVIEEIKNQLHTQYKSLRIKTC